MHSSRWLWFVRMAVVLGTSTLCGSYAFAQAQTPPRPAQPTQAGRGNRPERAPDYPVRAPAPPEQLARGEQLFKSNCAFCHGSDARGGETGPNLVRDQIVLTDQQGELITPIVQSGIPARGMPKFTLSATEIADIAAWLHAQPLSDRGASSTLDVLVGNAKAGETYFNGAGRCTQCHSVTGDLAGIGGKFDPKTLQNMIVSGGAGRGRRGAASATPRPVPTVTVTLSSGQSLTGELDHISAFVVALREADGTYRSFARHDSIPKVVVNNPMQWHVDMLDKWRDSDIHNLTSYLTTLK